jgi:hypothetical protein
LLVFAQPKIGGPPPPPRGGGGGGGGEDRVSRRKLWIWIYALYRECGTEAWRQNVSAIDMRHTPQLLATCLLSQDRQQK